MTVGVNDDGTKMNVTATEVKQMERDLYANYKPSPEFIAAEEDLMLPALDQMNKMMEEMAGKDKSEFGKREPGERGMYELQRLENAKERLNRKET